MEAVPELEDGILTTAEKGLSQPLLQKDRSTIGTTGISHMAIVGADGSLIESLDYEVLESDLFNQDWRARTQYEVLQYVILKWTFAFLVGLFTGLVGIFINVAVENIAGARLLYAAKLIYSNQLVLAFSIVTGCNVLLVLFSALLCVYIGPAAAGSGIPEVKAYLNGIDAPEILSPNTLLVKVFGSIGAVAGGLYVGKEGPLVHIGACIASLLGQGGSRKHHLTFSWLRLFKNDRDRRDLVTFGAAAGVAAAFRAPVGGVLFALEEATSWWRSSLLWRSFFTTAVVAVVLRFGNNWCKAGKCGLFGEGGLIMFDISKVDNSTYGFPEVFAVVILGVSGGMLGSLFNALNTRICIFYAKTFNVKGPAAKIFLACFVACVTSACCFGLPLLAPCRPCPELTPPYQCPTYGHSGNFRSFNCPKGHYNDLAGLVFTTKDDAIRNLFSTGTAKEYHYMSIIIFFVASYIIALLTYGIAVPSGLFIPVILCGATYGRLVGMLSTSAYDLKGLDEGVYAVLGAAAFLGGCMRMTVSLCVILLELTNNLPMLPLIMLVLLASKTVGDSFNMAIYNLHLKIKGFPILEAHPEPFMHQLTAKDAVKAPLVKLCPVERVGQVMHILRTTKHNAFPVVEEPLTPKATFAGLVLRSHLLILLEKKDFYFTRSSTTSCRKILPSELAKPGSGKGLSIDDIKVTPEEEDMYVNLQLIINASPYTVLETMSLAKAYTLFRQLGLRHICVMPRKPEGEPILGILTRHDFMHNHLLSIHPHLSSSLLKDRSFLRQASSDRHP